MIEMQKKVAKLESQVKDLHDDLNTMDDIVTKLTERVKRLEQMYLNMVLEEDEPVENTDYEQLSMDI